VLHWIPIFTNKESVNIVIDSLKYLQQNRNLKIYAYVILENHLHLIAQSDDIAKDMARFKSFTARKIIEEKRDRLNKIYPVATTAITVQCSHRRKKGIVLIFCSP
jgi:REP element-mobilizing transposase RayT